MPTVRYTDGGVYRVAGHSFEPGDEQDVEPDLAEHLADVDGFECVDETSEGDDEESTDEDEASLQYEERKAIEDRIDAGECPWCDEYEGENVGQHASSAHPDEWDAYKED